MPRSYMTRRNGASVEQFAVIVDQLGEERLAYLIRKYANDPDVRPALEAVAALAMEIVGEADLTDREAWLMLADLVETLDEFSAVQRRAYAEAFRAEAQAA